MSQIDIAKDLISISSPQMVATTIQNSVKGHSVTSYDLHRHCITWVYLHTCTEYTHPHKIKTIRGWINGSMVKSNGCSYRGLEFSTQHPLGG